MEIEKAIERLNKLIEQSAKLKKCPVARKLTRVELEESRNITAKIIKKIHGGLTSELSECVELHTTLRRLAALLEFNQFIEEEKTALHQCLLNIDGKEEFYLEPIVVDENLPLTLDELKETNCQPIWIKNTNSEIGLDGWAIFRTMHIKQIAHCLCEANISYYMKDYGVGWLAYRRKPEEEKE